MDWDEIAPWLIEALFDDEMNRMAFVALADAGGDLQKAIEIAAPDARDVLERAAMADLNLVPEIEARTLIGAAARRELRRRSRIVDQQSIEEDRAARLDVEALSDLDRTRAQGAAESLLAWLHRRTDERDAGA